MSMHVCDGFGGPDCQCSECRSDKALVSMREQLADMTRQRDELLTALKGVLPLTSDIGQYDLQAIVDRIARARKAIANVTKKSNP